MSNIRKTLYLQNLFWGCLGEHRWQLGSVSSSVIFIMGNWGPEKVKPRSKNLKAQFHPSPSLGMYMRKGDPENLRLPAAWPQNDLSFQQWNYTRTKRSVFALAKKYLSLGGVEKPGPYRTLQPAQDPEARALSPISPEGASLGGVSWKHLVQDLVLQRISWQLQFLSVVCAIYLQQSLNTRNPLPRWMSWPLGYRVLLLGSSSLGSQWVLNSLLLSGTALVTNAPTSE